MAEPHVNRFHEMCVNRPTVVMAVTFFVSVVFTAGAMSNFPKLAQGGFEARDSLVQERVDAMFMLELQTSNGQGNGYVYFEARNGNALDQENLERQCNFEIGMFAHSSYSSVCNKEEAGGAYHNRSCGALTSLVPLLFEMDKAGCPPTTLGGITLGSQRCISTCVLKTEWKTHLQRIADPTLANDTAQKNVYKQFRTIFLARDTTNYELQTGATAVKSRYVRTMLNAHDYDKLVKEVLNPVAKAEGMQSTSAPLRCYFRDSDAFFNQMLSDMRLVMASIIAVFFYMWFNTQSLFLTICGLFEVRIVPQAAHFIQPHDFNNFS